MKYLDTSAFVKYYADPQQERGAREIAVLIDRARAGKEVLVTSLFTLAEAASVFDRWLRLKAIDANDAKALLARLFTDVHELNATGGLIVEDVNALSILFGIELVIKHHLTINDALHLYTALKSRSRIDRFVSADQVQLAAAAAEGLLTWNPESP